MRMIMFSLALVAGFATTASAQSRFAVGSVARVDRVFVEGGASGSTPVAGVTTTATLSRLFAVEGEVTWASNPIEHSYEGWFVSYTDDPNATREEIERMAPIARRTLGYEPGMGWAAAFVACGAATSRVSLSARIGVSARRYLETSAYTLLSTPDGVDPARITRDFQPSSNHKTRGGLLAGVGASFKASDRFAVAPELRFVYGGPAQIGNKHRELGFGLRATWGL